MAEENRSTHKVYEKDKIGEVQIADEVVAIIAGLAATEVEGVDSRAQHAQRPILHTAAARRTDSARAESVRVRSGLVC